MKGGERERVDDKDIREIIEVKSIGRGIVALLSGLYN